MQIPRSGGVTIYIYTHTYKYIYTYLHIYIYILYIFTHMKQTLARTRSCVLSSNRAKIQGVVLREVDEKASFNPATSMGNGHGTNR